MLVFFSFFHSFPPSQLVGFALRALKEATADVLSAHTCSVAFLGKGLPFQLLEKNHLATILARMEQ